MDPIPPVIPVLPIRNAVLFPSVSMPLVIGRRRSIRALEKAEASDGLILIVAQRNMTSGDPKADDLFRVGTLCKIESVNNTDVGSRQIVATGISRYQVADFQMDGETTQSYLTARGEPLNDLPSEDSNRDDALFLNLKLISKEILALLPGKTDPLVKLVERVDDPSYLTNICAAYLNLSLAQKQDLLETLRVDRRIELVISYMRKEREVLSLQQEIRDKMSERLNKAQRDALLREQLRTIKSELGEESLEEESDDLENKIRQAELSEEADKQARDELKRMKGLPPASAEYHVIRSYLEWLIAMPWKRRTPFNIDIERARIILEEDHYGLEIVKKRILQFLAVAKLKNDLHGPILCLVGPPGVGKTSLGHSIARALELKFIRTSLGGVRDEAEIRGHRRTYVGAMPGRIVQSIKRAGSKNPVMMLDEIDKLRADYQGDPSSAMLEVLDPEQNSTFVDHYLDVPFDLSEVFFLATANVTDTIPAPLRDRMEIIEVGGYTSREKLVIARRYLLPKLLHEHGLKPEWIDLSDETLQLVISNYTREAGIRELERKIAALLRASAEEYLLNANASRSTHVVHLTPTRLKDLLGVQKFFAELAEEKIRAGIATGLAWTPHGGDIIFIEATLIENGRGNLTLTGQLGEVMRESAQIAMSLVRSSHLKFGRKLEGTNFNGVDVHIHVPAGAIPKDGPSAGVTLLAALASLFTGKSLEPTLAMTGEITLRGTVLPVGGVKEKVLAAHRAGVKRLLLPARNEPDLEEVPQDVRDQLKFVFVKSVDDVIEQALEPKLMTSPPEQRSAA